MHESRNKMQPEISLGTHRRGRSGLKASYYYQWRALPYQVLYGDQRGK